MRGARGRLTLQADFSGHKPYPYNSRIARHAKLTTVSKTVWDRALSPWAQERLDAPNLSPALDDDTRCDGSLFED